MCVWCVLEWMAFVTNKEIFHQRIYVYTKTALIDSVWKRMHGFILNRGLSPVFILMKQAKKNSFKMLPAICSRASCAGARFRINHVAGTSTLPASRMPVRLEVFLQFSFSNIVFMFLLQYTCIVFHSRNSRKAFNWFLSKRLVLLLYGNLCIVHKTTYLWSMSSPGGGELSLSACPGWGIDRQMRTKLQFLGGMPGGGEAW